MCLNILGSLSAVGQLDVDNDVEWSVVALQPFMDCSLHSTNLSHLPILTTDIHLTANLVFHHATLVQLLTPLAPVWYQLEIELGLTTHVKKI